MQVRSPGEYRNTRRACLSSGEAAGRRGVQYRQSVRTTRSSVESRDTGKAKRRTDAKHYGQAKALTKEPGVVFLGLQGENCMIIQQSLLVGVGRGKLMRSWRGRWAERQPLTQAESDETVAPYV